MIVKLLTERHLEFLSLKGCCTGSSESTLVKMSNCWKSRALAHLLSLMEETVLVKAQLKRHTRCGIYLSPAFSKKSGGT